MSNNYFQGYEEDPNEEAHERRIVRCKSASCRAKIIWFKTADGNNMPVDADTVEASDQEYIPGKHISHFATCPEASKHRKKKTTSQSRQR